jgi:hypothetical protein
MAFQSQETTQPQLWQPDTQPDAIDAHVGGIFYNLDTQDALPDFQEPAKVRGYSNTLKLARLVRERNDARFTVQNQATLVQYIHLCESL